MRKKAFLALMLTLTIISSSGCQTEIKPADPKDGKYATQTSMTSLEYALYMNKQITVFTNQLSTRMAVAANHKDVQSSNESYMTQQSTELPKKHYYMGSLLEHPDQVRRWQQSDLSQSCQK